jgi:hypothetical protein
MAIRSADLKKNGFKLSSMMDNDAEPRNGESKRDRDRRVLTALMQGDLSKCCALFIVMSNLHCCRSF